MDQARGAMKKALAFFLLAVTLFACAGPSGPTAYNCGEGVCTTVQVIEPVRPNEAATVTIAVTGDRGIPNLGISLTHDYGGEVEEPPASERATITFRGKNGVDWDAPVKAISPSGLPVRFGSRPEMGFSR
jgi:hypothetical protein